MIFVVLAPINRAIIADASPVLKWFLWVPVFVFGIWLMAGMPGYKPED